MSGKPKVGPPTEKELARRARRAKLNKYQKLADVNKDGNLNDEERRQARMYEELWDNLGINTPPASVYGDEEKKTANADGETPLGPLPTQISKASLVANTFNGVALGTGYTFGTYAGKCRPWTTAEKATIKLHMAWKKKQEAKWAEAYGCVPVRPSCGFA